jgi:hypothetical protein
VSLTRKDDCPCEGAPDGSSIKCPVCERGDLVVSSRTAEYEICTVCGWQHDHVCEGSPDVGPLGPNQVSFNEARANFAQFGESRS